MTPSRKGEEGQRTPLGVVVVAVVVVVLFLVLLVDRLEERKGSSFVVGESTTAGDGAGMAGRLLRDWDCGGWYVLVHLRCV